MKEFRVIFQVIIGTMLSLIFAITVMNAGPAEKQAVQEKQKRLQDVKQAAVEIKKELAVKVADLKLQKDALQQKTKQVKEEAKANARLIRQQAKSAEQELKTAAKRLKEKALSDQERNEADSIEKQIEVSASEASKVADDVENTQISGDEAR